MLLLEDVDKRIKGSVLKGLVLEYRSKQPCKDAQFYGCARQACRGCLERDDFVGSQQAVFHMWCLLEFWQVQRLAENLNVTLCVERQHAVIGVHCVLHESLTLW